MPPIHQHLADVFWELGLHGVIEYSLKITAHAFHQHRYVIGVDAARVNDFQLRSLLSYFNPSYAVAESFLALADEATTYLFGQEGCWSSGSRKMYAECWNRLDSAQGASSCHVMDSWKWRAGQSQDWLMSRYSVMPQLGSAASCARLIEFVSEIAPLASLSDPLRMLLQGLGSCGSDNRCAQLWRTEDLGRDGIKLNRRTFDLNLIDYELPVALLRGLELGQCFPEHAPLWSMWLEQCSASGRRISHLAAGVDRYDDFYFTVYYC